jgi:hypothetical protein
MRIKIIGENHCARATRHLLRLAGFAVTDFLPAEAVTRGPNAGYTITIDLAPAPHTPDSLLRPESATQLQGPSTSEEAERSHRDASSPSFVEVGAASECAIAGIAPTGTLSSCIHFDSVDSALEAAVLRHVTQLAAGAVILDRPGGVVHSERDLRIVAPNTGDARADEAAAVAIEFGVLRGMLDLMTPGGHLKSRGVFDGKKILRGDAGAELGAAGKENIRSAGGRKKWWPFAVVLLAGGLGILRGSWAAAPVAMVREGDAVRSEVALRNESVAVVTKGHRLKPILLRPASARLAIFGGAPFAAQGQFATGQGIKITDGTNFLVVDPCKAQTKVYASINQTGDTQLVTGTAAKKIYVCSIHVVAAAATNVAVVEGTGTVCGTGTAGVSGFGGATAATGWNFAGNGGIALGNGDSSLGAEGTSGDNLCIFNSGSGQVSGGISYVVE